MTSINLISSPELSSFQVVEVWWVIKFKHSMDHAHKIAINVEWKNETEEPKCCVVVL